MNQYGVAALVKDTPSRLVPCASLTGKEESSGTADCALSWIIREALYRLNQSWRTTWVATLILAAIAACPSAYAAAAAEDVADHAVALSIDWDGMTLAIEGEVSSTANEEKLQQLASAYFADATRQFELHRSVELPPGWSLVTELALRAVAETRSSTTRISGAGIKVDGFTDNFAAWQKQADFLGRYLLPGMGTEFAVGAVAPEEDPLAVCRTLISNITAANTINFSHGSDRLSPSAYPMLDEVVQIAADCPNSIISITGHTDSSGDENLNLALSEARAQAVVAYIVSRGIPQDRTRAKGAGSSVPLNDEVGSRSRSRNRRIDITLEDS